MKNTNGFSLVELLIGIALSALAWTIVVGMLGTQFKTVQTLTNKIDVETNVRHIMILLEKQIERSDCIIIEDGRYHFRDPENANYLNYYSLEGIYLYKNKVRENLRSIGLGAKSQMASPITFFQLEPQSNGRVVLTVESTLEGQIYRFSKVITPVAPVYTVG